MDEEIEDVVEETDDLLPEAHGMVFAAPLAEVISVGIGGILGIGLVGRFGAGLQLGVACFGVG